MRFADKAVFLMSDDPTVYQRLDAECSYSEHEQPGMKCDRGTQQRFANQDQSNAQTDRTAVNNNLQNYDRRLGDYMSWGDKTYGAGGDYMKTMNTVGNDVASAGAKTLGGNLALNKMRTGENTAGYAGTVAESGRESGRELTDFLGKANADRMSKLAGVKQFGVSASALPAQLQASMYGTDMSGANENAKFQDFGDELMTGLIGAGGEVGAGFAKGGH